MGILLMIFFGLSSLLFCFWGMWALWVLGFLLLLLIFWGDFVGVLPMFFFALSLFVVLLFGTVCIVGSWVSLGVFDILGWFCVCVSPMFLFGFSLLVVLFFGAVCIVGSLFLFCFFTF